MEERLLQLFPDQVVQLKEYTSFVNQPERIQISSQEDINDYDPNTLTNYYNFRVRLPRPALNVKSIQLARASIPNAIPNIPDTECTFWYYALPQVSTGTIYLNNAGVPGAAAYTFDSLGNLFNSGSGLRVRSGKIYVNKDDVAPTYTTDSAGVVYTYPGNVIVTGASINYTTGIFIVGGISYLYNTVAAEATPFLSPSNPIPMISGNIIGFYLEFAQNNINFDSGLLVIDGDVNSPYTYDIADAITVPLAPVPATYGVAPGTIAYWVEYDAPELATLRSNYLRYIRLVPSNAQPELMNAFTGGFNRTFQDYADLESELNNSTTDDPLNGEPSNEVPGTFKFIADQISFTYNDRFNKMIFTGLDSNFRYLPCATDDPLWPIAATQLQARDRANTRWDFSGIIEIVQPFQLYRTLNLRLGFNYAIYPQGDNFINMIRPIPPYIASPPPGLGVFTEYDHVAPGYIDLVYTSCCHLYTDITGGSTVDSIANKALLASIPLNTTNLGVGFHSLPLNNPLTKIATQLNEIYIEMRTDSGQPFYIGNNAIVSLELILTY